jgi:hypothetical protein
VGRGCEQLKVPARGRCEPWVGEDPARLLPAGGLQGGEAVVGGAGPDVVPPKGPAFSLMCPIGELGTDGVERARTSGIMRFSQPHDHGGSSCPPTHHPRSCRAYAEALAAVDGKTLRGARRATDDRQVHLLAAMDHATRAVLAQQQLGGAPEEVLAFQPLLANLDLAGTVVTADALHTHPAAEFLVATKQAHYLLTVKASQPTLLDRCAGLAYFCGQNATAQVP